MAEAFVGDRSRDFWQEVSYCKTNKQTSAPYVNGVHGDASIANLWVSKLKDLLTSPDPLAHSQLDDMFLSYKITRGELEATKVMPDIIQRSIKKRGKSDGETLISDHLISAPVSLSKILAPSVSSLLRHGHMLPCLSDTVVQLIPKGGNKDCSLSVNHRGIALASCLSKVIELCIL